MARTGKTLLFVDDNQVALSGWSLYLQQHGYTVVSAANPEEGLQIFATQPLDAVILDYAMPELNGEAVSALMKRLKPDVPIVMFTGVSELPAAILHTIDAVMTKGRPPADLLAMIDRLFDAARIASAA
jgi:CheY-like chemotaxis protein